MAALPARVVAALPAAARWVAAARRAAQGNPIKVYADAGPRPLFDFRTQPRGQSSQRGIEIRGDHWPVRGIEVANAADNGILISGSHNVVEDVVLHHNEDTGLQILVSEGLATDATRGAHNQVGGRLPSALRCAVFACAPEIDTA